MRYRIFFELQINFNFICKYIVFVFLIFNSITIYSQTKSYTITGHVIDSLSQKPISNINIVSIEDNIGVVTNNNGFFEMVVSSSPITLEFSFVGYYNKQTFILNVSDTNFLVRLSPKTYTLNEVTILSDNNTYNSQINNFTLLDYDFIGDSILILQKRRSLGGIPSLILLDKNYDTLLFNKDIPRGSNKIFKDCLNSYHLITKDSAYQIVINHDNILFYEPHDIDWFYETLENCLFKKGENIFFEFSIYQGYGHEIIFVDETNKKKYLFLKYVDEKSLYSLRDDISTISSTYFLHSVVNASTNDSLTVSHINNYNRDSRFINDIADQAIENTICLFNDTIFYFNYYESKIQSFSNVHIPPNEVKIDCKNTFGWGPNLQVDQIEGKIYSIIKSKLFYKVYLVNTKLGKLDYITKVSIFRCENLKINNGFIYYLSSPNSSKYHVKKLSRIRLGSS